MDQKQKKASFFYQLAWTTDRERLPEMSSLEEQKLPKMEIHSSTELEDVHKLASATQSSFQDIQLDPTMEKKTLRRFDMFLLPQIAILIVIGYLDRSNIGKDSLTHTLSSYV